MLMHLLERAYGCSWTEVDSLVDAIETFRISIDEFDEYDVFREWFWIFEIHQAVLEIIKSRMLWDEPDLMEQVVEWYVPWGRYITYHFVIDNEEHYKQIQKYCDENHWKQWSFRFLAHSSYKRWKQS